MLRLGCLIVALSSGNADTGASEVQRADPIPTEAPQNGESSDSPSRLRRAIRVLDPRPAVQWAVRTVRSIGKEDDKTNPEVGEEGVARSVRSTVQNATNSDDPQRIALKLQSIHFLAALDFERYPEALDTLLATLDDESEIVRHATLVALRRMQQESLQLCQRLAVLHQVSPRRDACGQCSRRMKVALHLESLLLQYDHDGRLQEPSERNRQLAMTVINESSSFGSTIALPAAPLPVQTGHRPLPPPPAAISLDSGFGPRWNKRDSAAPNESPTESAAHAHHAATKRTKWRWLPSRTSSKGLPAESGVQRPDADHTVAEPPKPPAIAESQKAASDARILTSAKSTPERHPTESRPAPENTTRPDGSKKGEPQQSIGPVASDAPTDATMHRKAVPESQSRSYKPAWNTQAKRNATSSVK